MDDSYNNTMSDDLPDLTTAQVKVPKQPRVKTQGDSTVATVVDDELSKLGWSDNARLSFLGDLGRENAWNRKTIFGGHSDPKNQTFNRGIISWQGDRRTNLDNFLKKEGVLGKNDDNELRSMVRFADQEMQNSPEWKSIAKKMRDPKISTYDASENLRKYIKYVPDGPYNSHDPEFRVKNNAQWAKQARKLGLGQLPDLSGAQGLPDLQNAIAPDDLPDLSSVAVGTDTPTNVIQQPQGQLPSENYTKRDTSQPGNYWNFETTGKAGDLDYLGMAGDKHLAKNKDGDTYEFDETAKAFRPTNPLTNRLKFEGGRELTKKKDDIYVDADNDEYKVTATPGKDGGYEYKRTPVNPYTKTVQLNDGTVLTRDAQIKGGFRYRAEDGTPYIYTTKGIRQANPPNWVNGKARPDTVQLPDARKTAYEEFRQSHNLKDSGELRKDWLRRDQLVAAGKQDDPYSQQEIDALSQLKTGTQVMPQQVEKAAQGPVARAALKPNELANIGQLPGIVPNQDLRADILKTDNGTAIKKVTNDPSYGVSPPEGFERFVDGNDQTYLVNTETGELKDESLAEIADRFKVKKVPFNMRGSVSVEDAQKRMAFQVADQIGAKYNLDKNDVYNYLLRKKLTDVGTDNRISESNLYETEEDARRANDRYNASSIGMPGQEGPSGTESTNSLTGRQLQDLLREVPAQTDAKERYALDRIVQGAISPNPSRAELEDLGVNLARLRQHPDFYAASKKGEQAQANIQRLTADLQQGGQFDEFSAPIESRAQLGIISREAANAELSAYKKTLDEKLAANGYLINATPQGVQGMSGRSVAMAGGMEPESQAVRQQRIQDWTRKQLQDDLRKNGTFAKYQESLAQAQMEEAARQQRMANEPLLDKINNRLMAVTLGPTKAAISGVASALQGFPIWTKPVADYIDSLGPNGKALATILSPILMGMRGMGGRDKASSIQQNPMYRAGGWMKETAQAALPTNKDYDKSFWWGSVPQGIGSSFASMPAAIGGPVGISLFASMQMTGDAFDEGIQTGASESDSAKYARINGAMFGWTETVGFGNIFQRMLKGPAAATWKKLVLEAIKESGEEVFLNEGPQSIGSDVLARLTIDPNRKWDASVMESMGAAGVSAPLVSVLISGLLHLKHSRQIKRVAKQDLLNGGPNVRDFGEEHGFYVFGKPVEETEDVKPLLERHRALQKELNDGFDQIKDIEAKYPRRTTKSLGMIRNVQGELLRLYQEQTQVADQIREQSGIPAPDILAQKNEAEEARDAAVAEDPAVPVAVPSESTSTEVTNEATNEQVPQPAASVVEDAVLPSGEDTQFDDETQVADDAKDAQIRDGKPVATQNTVDPTAEQPPVEPIDEPIRTLPSRKFARKAEQEKAEAIKDTSVDKQKEIQQAMTQPSEQVIAPNVNTNASGDSMASQSAPLGEKVQDTKGEDKTNSVYTDDKQEPVTFYHSTKAPEGTEITANHAPQFGRAVYLASDPKVISGGDFGKRTLEAHVPSNLLDASSKEFGKLRSQVEEESGIDYDEPNFPIQRLNDLIKDRGYKGIIHDHAEYGKEVAIFDAKDVKWQKPQDTKGSDVPIKAEDVPIEKGFEMKPTDTKPTLPPLTDNYRKPLSEYAPTLYRETNVAQAIDLLSGDSLDAKPFFSNTPNLAKGQGSNKGVTIELNSEGLQGQVNKKPGWEFTYQNGEAEFVGTHNKSYRDNVKSVTIDKASLPKSRRLYQYLEQSGFEKTKNSDGSITFARPRGAETSATGNNGNFDATNTDITFAKSAEITAAAKELEGARTLPDDDIFTEMELDTLINDGDGVGRIDSVDMAVAFERLMAMYQGDVAKSVGDIGTTFKKWFGKSKVVDKNGKPKRLIHATTHANIKSFDSSLGNIENHFGQAIYLTDSTADSNENYAGEGGDLTNRIEREAERIEQKNEVPYDEAVKLAKERIKGQSEGLSMPLYAKIDNPLIIEPNGGTRFDALGQYDEDTDDYTENEDSLPMQMFNAMERVQHEYDGVDVPAIFGEISEKINNDWDGITAYEVDQAFRQSESAFEITKDVEGEFGALANNDFIKEVYKEMGFDGIIMNADVEFGSKRKQGKRMAMDADTKHYIVFDSNQVKSAIGNNGNFDPNNPDITKHTSNDGAFDGFFLDPDQVKDFVATINRYADSVDFDNTDLKAVAKFITDTADERGLIMLWNDDALNEEKAHRVLAEIRTAERAKQVGKEVSDKIVNSDVFKNALNGRFGRNYGNAKQATQVEEFAVKAALGQYDQIGVTAETQREAVGLAADFFESAMATAAKNGKFTREQIADKFASEIAYASQTREEQESRVVQKETSKTQERDDDLKRSETDKGAEDRRDTGNAEASIIEAPDSLVNYKNRKHAEYLREHGLDAEDVPYIPETERGWQLKGREIVNDSLAAKGDYSDAIAEFNNPTKITGGERTALGYELIDRLGAEGDYDAMRKITDGVVIHEGQAGAILRAAQIVGKYDFAKAAEIAQKAVQKKGRSLTDKEISDLRKETAKYAEKEEELATAIQIFEEAKAENERIKADIADMGSSLAEMNERKSVDDKTIASLKRMVSYWKNKKVTTSSPIRSAVYKDLVAKKQANEDILKAKFGGKDITFSKPDSPKAMFTAEERQALVDLTAMAILEHRPYTTLIQNIKDQTGLTDVEVGAIHADAVANLTAKSGQKQSDNVKKALEIRREHKKQAKLFRDGGMVLTRLDREILKNVTDPQEVFATLLWNRSLNPHDFKTQIQKEFPDLKDEDVKRLIRKVGGLRSDAKQSLIRQMAERKSNQTVSDVELKKFQTAKRIAQSRVRQARQSMDTYFRTLQRSLVAKGVDAAMEAVNFLKGTAATGDISYLFRQGLLPLITDTRAAIKADWQGIGHGLQGDNELWAKLAKKAGREDVEQFILEHNVTQFIEKVREHPRHSEAQAMGIRFAEIGDHNIADEHFSSKMLEKIPVYKRLELAYTLPGDLQRLFVYDVWANAIEGQGLNTQQELVAKKYATQVINALTGKGDISKVLAQGGALSKLANVTFFSPSLLISRFQSAYYLTTGFATAPKGMRMMMAKKGMRVWGALALVAYLLGMSFDPDDDDFGKIKVRKDSMLSKAFNTDTKLDVLAGMSTPIQLMFRAAASMTKYAQTGDSGYLSDAASETWQQFGTNKRNEPRFLRGKLSPSASWLVDYGTGTDYIGKPYTHWNAITSRLTPLSWGQAYDAMMYDRADAMMKEPVTQERAKERWNNQDRDMGNALSILLPSIFGIGVNQYPQSEVSPATKKAGDMRDYVSRKDSETIRIEGGLRNLIKEKMDMQGRGENTAQIDNDIKRYATKYAQSLSKLTSQAKSETGLLSFYATGLNVDQLQRVLPLANDAERKVLEKLLDAAKNKPKQKDTPKVSTSTKTEGLPSLKIKGLPSL